MVSFRTNAFFTQCHVRTHMMSDVSNNGGEDSVRDLSVTEIFLKINKNFSESTVSELWKTVRCLQHPSEC